MTSHPRSLRERLLNLTSEGEADLEALYRELHARPELSGHEVAIKARGKAISRAVDTAEIALNRFLDDVAKKEILTSTEVIDTDSGKTNVSSIEIILTQRKELA